MKLLTAILILFGIWYLAGMYRIQTLMTMVICAAVVLAVLVIIMSITLYSVNIKIPPQEKIAYKYIEKLYHIQATNKSRLPVNKLCVHFNMHYKNDRHKTKKKFYGSASGKKSKETDTMGFYFILPYCGVVNIHLKKLKVFDWLSLFCLSKHLKETEEIYVLPVDREIKLSMPMAGFYSGDPVTLNSSDQSGNDFSDIKLIREYRTGDMYRYLHRNYTARTGTPWIKEYHKENDFVLDLLLDTSGEKPHSIERMDAFYEITYSVINALIGCNAILRLHWFNKQTGLTETAEISNAQQLPETMIRLYRTDIRCTPEEIQGVMAQIKNSKMVINTNLEWYFGEEPIFCFTEKGFEAELTGNIFEF